MHLIHDNTFSDPAAHQAFLTRQASAVIQAQAQAALNAQQQAVDQYLEQMQQPDWRPFEMLPEGSEVRDLADGMRLFVLPDGAFLRTLVDGGFHFAGAELHLLQAEGRHLNLPGGLQLTLLQDDSLHDDEASMISGLPADAVVIRLAAGRFRVDFADGLQLFSDHGERRALLIDPGGSVLVLSRRKLESLGENLRVHDSSDGGRGFEAQSSGHQGFIAVDGAIHLTLSGGLDLIISFPNPEPEPTTPTGPGYLPCCDKGFAV